jgi:hypothetical protein
MEELQSTERNQHKPRTRKRCVNAENALETLEFSHADRGPRDVTCVSS